jgi:hypothetical protein
MSILARQGAAYAKPWSLTRDDQLRTQLETALHRLHGVGVISGGIVTKAAGYTARVPSGTVFLVDGVELTLAGNQDHTHTFAAALVYLWGTITRTAANQANRADSDTYALSLSQTTTSTPPSTSQFLLAKVPLDGSGIISSAAIDNGPDGKFIRALMPLQQGQKAIAAGQIQVIEDGRQFVVSEVNLTGSGELHLNGTGLLHIL